MIRLDTSLFPLLGMQQPEIVTTTLYLVDQIRKARRERIGAIKLPRDLSVAIALFPTLPDKRLSNSNGEILTVKEWLSPPVRLNPSSLNCSWPSVRLGYALT
jgi:hypothetical protein